MGFKGVKIIQSCFRDEMTRAVDNMTIKSQRKIVLNKRQPMLKSFNSKLKMYHSSRVYSKNKGMQGFALLRERF